MLDFIVYGDVYSNDLIGDFDKIISDLIETAFYSKYSIRALYGLYNYVLVKYLIPEHKLI